jgi:alpha-galactosidase
LDAVRVTGGFNPFDFGYVTAPRRAAGDAGLLRRLFGDHGLGGASRLLHRFELERILPHWDGAPPTAAQAAAGDLQLVGGDRIQGDEAGQMALAEKAAALGVTAL